VGTCSLRTRPPRDWGWEVTAIKLSDYTGDHVVLNDEVEYVERLHELLEEGELDEEATVFTVEEKPLWGHIINADRVLAMIDDYLYEEVEDWDLNNDKGGPVALTEALNAWAAKHLTGTVRVGTSTRIDISELFKDGEK
jgi:hypothetical protein